MSFVYRFFSLLKLLLFFLSCWRSLFASASCVFLLPYFYRKCIWVWVVYLKKTARERERKRNMLVHHLMFLCYYFEKQFFATTSRATEREKAKSMFPWIMSFVVGSLSVVLAFVKHIMRFMVKSLIVYNVLFLLLSLSPLQNFRSANIYKRKKRETEEKNLNTPKVIWFDRNCQKLPQPSNQSIMFT